MRSIVALGVVSLAVAAGLVACGDDSSDDRPSLGGSGGTSGGSGGRAGGGAGGGGAGGTGGGNGGTSSGGGGAGGGGGAAPALATCTGCVELIVPVTGPNDNGGTTNLNDQVGYQITFPAPGVDFSDGVVTWRIAAVEPNANFFINLYAQNGAPGYAGIFPVYTALAPAQFAANTFVDVTLDISAYASIAGDAGTEPPPAADAGDAGGPIDPGNFNKAAVEAIGIQVGATGALTGNAIVRVAVDSINITGVTGQANRTFTTTAEGLAINMYQVPTGTQAPVVHP
jgi:hypothetical protein